MTFIMRFGILTFFIAAIFLILSVQGALRERAHLNKRLSWILTRLYSRIVSVLLHSFPLLFLQVGKTVSKYLRLLHLEEECNRYFLYNPLEIYDIQHNRVFTQLSLGSQNPSDSITLAWLYGGNKIISLLFFF